MMGFDAPYVPGWDCHGLPIEKQVDKKLGSKKREMDALAIRKACREYAASYIDVQRAQFRRLGVGGEWDRPYSTMDLPYEAEIARTFGAFYRKNLVYQALKSVRWCFTDQTALAEAELEYEERSDPAITVAFPMEDPQAVLGGRASETGTPRSSRRSGRPLPGRFTHAAIAVHPDTDYTLLEHDGSLYIVAAPLAASVAASLHWDPVVAGTARGSSLAGLRYRHPLSAEMRGKLEPEEEARSFRLVAATYVTMDAGTGLVHTAPGHGEDDFVTGKNENLPILSPVDAAGRFTTAEKYQGTLRRHVHSRRDQNSTKIRRICRSLAPQLRSTAASVRRTDVSLPRRDRAAHKRTARDPDEMGHRRGHAAAAGRAVP